MEAFPCLMRNPETELPVNSQLVSSESSMDYLQPFPIQGCILVECIQLFPTVGGMLFTTFSNPGWELDFPPTTTFPLFYEASEASFVPKARCAREENSIVVGVEREPA